MSSEEQRSMGLGEHLVAAAQQESDWVVRIRDVERRLTTREVVDAYNERLIDPETYVWRDGMRTWEQLQMVDPLVDALHADAALPEPPAPRPPPVELSPLGARHEDSAIFSLAMLTSEQEPVASIQLSTEDSGLIDLAALTAADPAPPAALEPLFQEGLFHAQAAAPAQAAPTMPPTGKNRNVVIGLVAAVAMLSAALVFQVVKSSGTPATAQPATTSVTETTTAVAVAPPPPTTGASPPSTERPTSPEIAAATSTEPPLAEQKTAANPRRIPNPVKQPAEVTPPTKSAPAKTGACQCKASDLDCHMRCAVK